MTRILGIVLAVGLAATAAAATRAYVTDSDPWGQTGADDGRTHMNNAFGAGMWDEYNYATAISSGIFNPGSGYTMIYLEGSDSQWSSWEAFVNTNRTLLESWVTGGGCLFMNAARQGGGNFDMGFGATLVRTGCGPNVAYDPMHPLFDVTTGTAWSGGSFNHDAVNGLTGVVRDDCTMQPSLAESTFGAGHVLLGGMTTTNFHNPIGEARALRVNILSYCDGLGIAGGVDILQVDAIDDPVVAGLGGYPATVSVENVGLNPVSIDMVDLTFFGTADRTAEYSVTPDPANPTLIAAAGTEVLSFLVDVDLMATQELVTLDASISVTDTVTMASFQDMDAAVTDTWTVVGCTAPACGDCNGDMVVTILDALVAAQNAAALVTLVGAQFSNCNVIGTLEPFPGAAVDILDALTLAQSAAGLPVVLVCC